MSESPSQYKLAEDRIIKLMSALNNEQALHPIARQKRGVSVVNYLLMQTLQGRLVFLKSGHV